MIHKVTLSNGQVQYTKVWTYEDENRAARMRQIEDTYFNDHRPEDGVTVRNISGMGTPEARETGLPPVFTPEQEIRAFNSMSSSSSDTDRRRG